MVDNKFLPKLSQNLLEIIDNDEEYYDVTIEVGNDSYVKTFRAHLIILNYRSPYLKRILSTNKKKDGEMVNIKLSNISPEIFQIILRYIYGGKISLKEYDISDIIKILVAANELSLHELIPYLQSFLIEKESNLTEKNFNLICQISFENDSFLKLQKFCTKLISKEPDRFFKSPDFTSISEKSLISLIKHDNLKVNEVQIWKHVLRWGFARNPKLSSDNLTNFSKDDFNILKNTLQNCISFINFFNLSSKEFLDKVLPYKKIFPKELYKNLLKNCLDSNYKPTNINSKIITLKHVGLISKWIDRLDITDNLASSYEFKLLFRGSRDGLTSKKFHEICDDKFCTVTIIKVRDSNEILGGYNPIGWKPDNSWYGSYGTKDSFIFSFINNDYILSRVKDKELAINYWSNYGSSFGNGDLAIYGDNFDNNWCIKRSYEKPIRRTEEKFFIMEYEVFQIIKNDA